jgi:hypothetical protein
MSDNFERPSKHLIASVKWGYRPFGFHRGPGLNRPSQMFRPEFNEDWAGRSRSDE